VIASLFGFRSAAVFGPALHLLKLRLAPENMMIVLREPMRFIANIFEAFSAPHCFAQVGSARSSLRVDQLFLLRERNHHRRLHVIVLNTSIAS